MMLEGLFQNDHGYTPFEISMYYTGGICWTISYFLTVRKIIKDKFLEFPIMAITANVVWEFIWGFFLELDFGGMYLIVLWRLAFFLDVFMFYTVLKRGKIQVSVPFLQKNYVPVMIGTAIAWGFLIYAFYQSGADLPMGFNSGMILNVMMSVLCLMMFWQMPNRKFSFWIALFRALGTDVFLMIYIFNVSPDLWFPKVTGVISFVLDGYYLYLILQRNKSLKNTEPDKELASAV